MNKLYTEIPESKEMVSEARGVLVFPSVLSAGFVVGGSHGKGTFLEAGSSVGYYSTAAGSVGLLAGDRSRALYLLFMTAESIDKFKARYE